jgi:hypothetical protein
MLTNLVMLLPARTEMFPIGSWNMKLGFLFGAWIETLTLKLFKLTTLTGIYTVSPTCIMMGRVKVI